MICLHARYSYIFLEVWRTLHPALDVKPWGWWLGGVPPESHQACHLQGISHVDWRYFSAAVPFPNLWRCIDLCFFRCFDWDLPQKTVYSNHPQRGIEAGDKANLALETLLVAFLSRLEELQGALFRIQKRILASGYDMLWLYNSSPWKDSSWLDSAEKRPGVP